MAIYHLSTNVHSRGKGHSAVSAAAYRSGEKLYDERLGETYNWQAYRKSHGEVLASEIFLPADADQKYLDRSLLWNAAETAEKTKAGEYKKTATIAREIEASLPHEMTNEERRLLAKQHAEFLVNRYGTAVDMNIHAPHPEGSDKNYHVHFLMTTRQLEKNGFTGKSELELDGRTKQKMGFANGKRQIIEMRENWSRDVNDHLQRQGYSQRVDHRSYEDQGIDKAPSKHLGVSATAMERDGRPSDRGDYNRKIECWNRELDELRWQESVIEAAIEKARQREAERLHQPTQKPEIKKTPEPALTPYKSVAEELDRVRSIEAQQEAERERIERIFGEHNRRMGVELDKQNAIQADQLSIEERANSIRDNFRQASLANDNEPTEQTPEHKRNPRGFER